MVDRRENAPLRLEQNRLAQVFLDEIDGVNRSYGLIGAIGLPTLTDWRTFRLNYAIADLREEEYWVRKQGPVQIRGLRKAIVYYSQKPRIGDPYQEALQSLESARDEHVEARYSDEDQRPFQIQSAAADLVLRSSVEISFPTLRQFLNRQIPYEHVSRSVATWSPTLEVVREWGGIWRERLATERPQGL